MKNIIFQRNGLKHFLDTFGLKAMKKIRDLKKGSKCSMTKSLTLPVIMIDMSESLRNMELLFS